jgi:hypothetical protein
MSKGTKVIRITNFSDRFFIRLFIRNCRDSVAMCEWGLETEVKRIHCSFSSGMYLK